jgi:hypothetical protein
MHRKSKKSAKRAQQSTKNHKKSKRAKIEHTKAQKEHKKEPEIALDRLPGRPALGAGDGTLLKQ